MKVKGTSKDPIKRCLEASQDVRLAEGRPSEHVYVHNYTDDPNSIKLPKFGNWRSLDNVKEDLLKAIDEEYPKEKYPSRKLGRITLWQRDETDPEYTCTLKEIEVEA